MIPAGGTRLLNSLVALSAALLALGLVIDFGLTRPHLQEVRRLGARRTQLLTQFAAMAAREQEGKELARTLGADDPKEALAAQQGEDPLSFLARLLQRSNLTRLEMASRPGVETPTLRRSSYSLRVLGSYDGILEFVRSLEEGPRLITVDAFSANPASESSLLEGRIDVSVYQAAARQGS